MTHPVFNKAERGQMIREFFYAEDEAHWRDHGNVTLGPLERADLHDYNLDNLYSSASDDLKNHSTRSIVLAPKNSTEDDEKIPVNFDAEVAEILKQRQYEFAFVQEEIITYKPKARKLNLRYENENNADMDNGVLNKHADQERVARRAEGFRDGRDGDRGGDSHRGVDQIRSSPGSGSATNAISPTRFERAAALLSPDREKYEVNTPGLDKLNQEIMKNPYARELKIKGDIVYLVAQYGYPDWHIVDSLLKNDNNHCTATYYL